MLTSDVEKLIQSLKNNQIFLPLGDFVEVRENGNGPHLTLKFGGPFNDTPARSEACPIVCERDFGRLALFFTALAKNNGVLGDTELAIREVLMSNATNIKTNIKMHAKSLDALQAAQAQVPSDAPKFTKVKDEVIL